MDIATQVDVNLSSSLKVLQLKGQRISVKLEDIYWEQLEKFADADQSTLTKLVHELVSGLDNSINRTAYLRCYCMQRLQQSASLSRSTEPSGIDLGSIITACPSPVFVLGADRKIVAYNPAFKTDFLSLNIGNQDVGVRPPLKLTFSQPFNTLKKFLTENPGRVVTAQVGFMQDESSKQKWVRFSLVDRTKAKDSLVIAFVGT